MPHAKAIPAAAARAARATTGAATRPAAFFLLEVAAVDDADAPEAAALLLPLTVALEPPVGVAEAAG